MPALLGRAELPSPRPLPPGNYEQHPADDKRATDDRRNIEMSLLIGADMDRPGVDHLLAFRVPESLVREREQAEKDQDKPEYGHAPHIARTPAGGSCPVDARGVSPVSRSGGA